MHRARSVSSATLVAGVLFAVPLAGADEVEVGAASQAWHSRLVELVQAVVARSPDLRAMELEVEAARHRVPQVDALPEPELELGLRDLPIHDPSFRRDDFTMETVTLRQALPARGERGVRRAVAAADADGAVAEHRGHLLGVISEAADSFFALAGIDHRLAILRDSRLRLENAAAAATERFRVGQGSQADVLRASLELTRLDETRLTLEAERSAGEARLNALLGRTTGTPIAEVAPPEDLDVQLAVPAIDELVRLAEGTSPQVLAARSRIAIADGDLLLAGMEDRPDWFLMGYYGRRESFDDVVGLSAAISLPWARRSRLAEKRAESEAEVAAAQARLEAVRARSRGEIGVAYAELEKQRRQLRLYRDVILPQAQLHFDSARAAYMVGRVDFPTLASAGSELDEYLQEAADRAAGIGRAVAALQRASGIALLPGAPAQGDDDGVH
jgi:outer membrane protein, heavy metal efflux system